MKKQMQGIAIVLMAILLNLSWGNQAFFDLDFRWNLIFVLIGVVGLVMTFLPSKKDK